MITKWIALLGIFFCAQKLHSQVSQAEWYSKAMLDREDFIKKHVPDKITSDTSVFIYTEYSVAPRDTGILAKELNVTEFMSNLELLEIKQRKFFADRLLILDLAVVGYRDSVIREDFSCISAIVSIYSDYRKKMEVHCNNLGMAPDLLSFIVKNNIEIVFGLTSAANGYQRLFVKNDELFLIKGDFIKGYTIVAVQDVLETEKYVFDRDSAHFHNVNTGFFD